MKFEPSEFVATQWDSQEQKAKFANHFIKFWDSNFDKKYFKKWFYQRLMNTFGHIAHYNQLGFWEEFFENNDGKQRFKDITLNHPCYGSPTHTYSDVEKKLQDYLTKAYAA